MCDGLVHGTNAVILFYSKVNQLPFIGEAVEQCMVTKAASYMVASMRTGIIKFII